MQKKSLKSANVKKQKVQSAARKTQSKSPLATKTMSLRQTVAFPPNPC